MQPMPTKAKRPTCSLETNSGGNVSVNTVNIIQMSYTGVQGSGELHLSAKTWVKVKRKVCVLNFTDDSKWSISMDHSTIHLLILTSEKVLINFSCQHADVNTPFLICHNFYATLHGGHSTQIDLMLTYMFLEMLKGVSTNHQSKSKMDGLVFIFSVT